MDHSESVLAAKVHAKVRRKIELADKHDKDNRIGNLLVKSGAISAGQIMSILARANKDQVSFGQAAVNSGLIGTDKLTDAVGDQFGYRLARLGKSRIDPRVVSAYHSDHSMVDQIRSIRSELILQWLGDASSMGRSLATVSENTSDGRSVFVANLGTAFAQAGFATLIIDANLRNPGIHNLFGLQNRGGLSTLLARRQKRSTVYRLREVPGLSIMPAGPKPPNPTELLSPTQLNRLFKSCAFKYQVVLVDTPAMQCGPDAELTASQTSGCVTLGVAGRSQIDVLSRRSDKLRRLGANLVGTVMVQA